MISQREPSLKGRKGLKDRPKSLKQFSNISLEVNFAERKWRLEILHDIDSGRAAIQSDDQVYWKICTCLAIENLCRKSCWRRGNTGTHMHTWANWCLESMEISVVSLKKKIAKEPLKGEVRRKMNFTYVLGFVVLRDVVKVFPDSSSSFARKTTGRNRARSHSGAWRGLKTKWDLKLSFPSSTYFIRYLFI